MNSWKNEKNSCDFFTPASDLRGLQHRLAHAPIDKVRHADSFFQASVILLLYEKSHEPYILTVLKTETPGYPWSNQVALPGGHMDDTDGDPLETALRELLEELCITPDHLRVAGTMGQFFTIRQTVIECFLALWDNDRSNLRYDPVEISGIMEVPVKSLRDTHESAGFYGRIPDIGELKYPYNGIVIWGVTARMIHFLLEHVII
ncbi:MAG: CoA pyrophosphatase [Desulfobacteraceae bacterium]|nr:CoA pyrophosphatase [Desulfobacteraceae bacterium]